MAIIAKIKLANGQVGYYDDYSRIYLTPSKPEAYIEAGTNLYQIKKSIKSGRLKLVEGSLTEEVKPVEISVENNVKKVAKKDTKVSVSAEESPSNIPEAKIEVIEEAVAAEPAEVEKPKRSRRKKNTEPEKQEAQEEPLEQEVLEITEE